MSTSSPELRTARQSASAVDEVRSAPTGRSRAVLRPGVVATIAAAAVTATTAAIASASGVSFADRSGSNIPTAGFAVLTIAAGLLGVALAAVLARRAARPRMTFIRTTVALVILSVIPDLVSGFAPSATVMLISTHLLAAAIIVPTLALRLADRR
jgi:hypothetical protein